MDGAIRPLIAVAAASGALAIAVLSFTGAVWPYAPDDAGRAHLAFANAFTGVGFFSCILCLLGAALGGAGHSGKRKTSSLRPPRWSSWSPSRG